MIFTFIIIFILALLAEFIHRKKLYQLIAGYHLVSPAIRTKLNWDAFSLLLRNAMLIILIIVLTSWFISILLKIPDYIEMISLMIIYSGLIIILLKTPSTLTKNTDLNALEKRKFRHLVQLNRLGLVILFLNYILFLVIFLSQL